LNANCYDKLRRRCWTERGEGRENRRVGASVTQKQTGRRHMAITSTVQDPVVTDGDKYSVVLENERVRVLRYHDKPGERTLPHAHRDYVLYAESSFKRRLTFPDGRKEEIDVKAGSIVWMKGHTHIGENIGDTNTDVIFVELKERTEVQRPA
jgi:hypothetical protein